MVAWVSLREAPCVKPLPSIGYSTMPTKVAQISWLLGSRVGMGAFWIPNEAMEMIGNQPQITHRP